MREIKFRGKRVDNGEWVYGAFVPDALETPDNDLITWGFIRRYNRDIGKMETIEVARESVGQYTGLCDKNGVEIYEGDIIVSTYKDMGTDTGLVVFKDCGFKVEIPNIGDDELVDWESYSDSIEVIGNIYENPDLLGVTE